MVGERFILFADCGLGAPCVPVDTTPLANVVPSPNLYNGNPPPGLPNLEYLPGAAPATSVAVPSCASASIYQQAVAGCDQTTVYQCGEQISGGGNPNTIDLRENPGGAGGDTATGLACLLTPKSTSMPLSGQDLLKTDSTPNPYPFVAIAGDANPLSISNSPITASNSIMSLPIYDASTTINQTGTTNVTIVGFLQVFVRDVNSDGSVQVTVLNVAGCGNVATNPPVFGSSPVPVRLITPPPPP